MLKAIFYVAAACIGGPTAALSSNFAFRACEYGDYFRAMSWSAVTIVLGAVFFASTYGMIKTLDQGIEKPPSPKL